MEGGEKREAVGERTWTEGWRKGVCTGLHRYVQAMWAVGGVMGPSDSVKSMYFGWWKMMKSWISHVCWYCLDRDGRCRCRILEARGITRIHKFLEMQTSWTPTAMKLGLRSI